MDKILVVGGTGFIGSHLVDNLLKNKFKVDSISFKKRRINNKANFFFIDLSKKINPHIIKKINPNMIVYAASLDHFDAEKKFDVGHQVGYLSLINLLNSEFIKKKLKKIIFLSTAQVYKNYCRENININSEIFPKNAYSLFHIQAENFLKYFALKNSINTICLRIANGYGEPFFNKTNSWNIVINDLCLQAYKHNLININSNPNDYRNFINVKDIAKEIVLNLKKKHNTNFIIKNIGSNKNLRIKTLAGIIKSKFKIIMNKNIKINYKNKKNNKLKIYKCKINNLSSTKKLISADLGVEKLIKYISFKNGKV